MDHHTVRLCDLRFRADSSGGSNFPIFARPRRRLDRTFRRLEIFLHGRGDIGWQALRRETSRGNLILKHGNRILEWVHEHRTETALFALCLLLRAVLLLARSLWYNEALTLVLAQARPDQLLPLIRALEARPPLYFLLMHFWIQFFADPMVAIRIFSFICGAAAVWVYYLLCLRVGPKNRLFAFFMACFSSYWIHYSQDGRDY